MKKETCLQLLQLLKKDDLQFNNTCINAQQLLDLNEELIKLVLNMNSTFQIESFFQSYNSWKNISLVTNDIDFQKNATNKILQCNDELKLSYITKLLCNETVIQAGIVLEGATVLSESNSHNIEYVYEVLCNERCINASIALEGAKIISESKTSKQAKFSKFVLCDQNSINASIALEGAKIINKSNHDFQPMYQNLVLRDENAINKGVALTGAEYILRSTEEYQAQNVSYVFRDLNVLDANLEKKGSNIILNTSKGLVNSQNIRDVVCSPYAIESGVALKGAKMISMTDCEYKSSYMRDALCSRIINQYNSADTSARIISNAKDELHAMYQKLVLCNENAVKNYAAIKAAYIINQLDEEYQLEYIWNVVNYNIKLLNSSGSEFIDSIPKPKINIDTIKLEDVIKLLEGDTDDKLKDVNTESIKEYIKVIKR